MFVPDNQDHSISRFLFISVILHGILFITYPQWSSMITPELPGLGQGGVIQVIAVESSPNRQPSPITNPTSQTTVPRVADPRPTADPPKKDAVAIEGPTQLPEPALPKPEPRPEPKPEIKPEVKPAPVQDPKPQTPTPQPQPEVKPATEVVPDPVEERPSAPTVASAGTTSVDASQILTSESGQAMVVAETREEVAPPPPAKVAPEVKPEQPISTETTSHLGESGGSSGSGDGKVSGDDQVLSGIRESGEGSAETAPPAPPPPPSGRSLHGGGGSPIYPKNAEHDGAEGTVGLEVTVASSGRMMSVTVSKTSGDSRLDEQARRTIERLWQFKSAAYDYVLNLDVDFARIVENGLVNFHAEVSFGEVRWLNAQ